MTDFGILFSPPMTRALLDGRKTMTRRYAWRTRNGDDAESVPTIWQKVRPGDRLWVREAWAHYQTIDRRSPPDGRSFPEISDGLAGYRADGHDTIEDFRSHVRLMSGLACEGVEINGDRWRPAIHMPRWASRLTLTVTATKIEPLQAITDNDARAEGIYPYYAGQAPEHGENVPYYTDGGDADEAACYSAKDAFRALWKRLHGPTSWVENPELVAMSFTVERRNIDQEAA